MEQRQRVAKMNWDDVADKEVKLHSLKDLVYSLSLSENFGLTRRYKSVDLTDAVAIKDMTIGDILMELNTRGSELMGKVHPAVKLDEVMAKHDVKIFMSEIQISGDTESKQIQGGYAIIDKEAQSPLVAHVSDMLAYTHRVEGGKIGRVVTSADTKNLGIPQINLASVLEVDGTTPQMYRDSYYRQMIEEKGGAQLLMTKIADQMDPKHVGPLGATEVALKKKYPALKAKVLKRVVPFRPPFRSHKSLDKMWREVAMHRAFRGSDGKGLNAITGGYYLMSMSRAIDRLTWQTVDILSAMKLVTPEIGRPAITVANISEDFSRDVAASLLLNGYDIVVNQDTTLPLYVKREKEAAPGIYSGRRTNIVYDTMKIGPSPIVKKLVVEWTTNVESLITYIESLLARKDEYIFRHVYLREELRPYEQYMLPSIHAHAGHVILTNRVVSPGGFFDQMMDRVTKANFAKTYFPFTRVPFGQMDEFCPGWLYKEGLMLSREILTPEQKEIEPLIFDEAKENSNFEFNAYPVEAWVDKVVKGPAYVPPLDPQFPEIKIDLIDYNVEDEEDGDVEDSHGVDQGQEGVSEEDSGLGELED